MKLLASTLRHQHQEAKKLDATIDTKLAELGYGG
jgi:hypothetical protein